MKRVKLGLLSKVIIAIAVAIACSAFFPEFLNRLFVTINVLIGNFINFIIPLIIVGLIVPGIAEIGSGAGKLLGMTVAIAYISTMIAGFFSYFTCNAVYPYILESNSSMGEVSDMASAVIKPYFTVEMPPVMDVTAALIISFVLGLGTVALKGDALKRGFSEFGELITVLIKKVIIPVLPLYIFTIFLKIGAEGQVGMILKMFIKVIALIFVMHIILLLFQFAVAGLISKKNPLKSLLTMLPAYMTALGTQSSAATIPVTLAQAKKNGINEDIAGFVIPLCATIHLSGSRETWDGQAGAPFYFISRNMVVDVKGKRSKRIRSCQVESWLEGRSVKVPDSSKDLTRGLRKKVDFISALSYSAVSGYARCPFAAAMRLFLSLQSQPYSPLDYDVMEAGVFLHSVIQTFLDRHTGLWFERSRMDEYRQEIRNIFFSVISFCCYYNI